MRVAAAGAESGVRYPPVMARDAHDELELAPLHTVRKLVGRLVTRESALLARAEGRDYSRWLCAWRTAWFHS